MATIEGSEICKQLIDLNGGYTDWHRLPQSLKHQLRRYQGVSYNLVYSETEPTLGPWELLEGEKFIRIGTSCVKGYGGTSTDSPMTTTFRSDRRSGTTQPLDRLRDHTQLIVEGNDCVLARKNYASQGKAWQPFWDEYGWGKDVANNVWVSLYVPHSDRYFNQQTLLLEMVELMGIAKHIDYHEDSPITDLKYRSKSAEEIYGKASARLTQINNDSSYDNKKTDNAKAAAYYYMANLFSELESST